MMTLSEAEKRQREAMNVTLEELQAFVVVIDSGSITAAAEQLG